MTSSEFSNQFDLLYNNITSNQAPGLTEYEKSVFLTKAQSEVVKNYFSANSKGNTLGQGFDDSAKRQADFSTLMGTDKCTEITSSLPQKIDPRDDTKVFTFPSDVFIVVNETIKTTTGKYLQVIPLKYDEYTRLMSKPFKRPLKNQAWRLINSGTNPSGNAATKTVEIITNVGDVVATNEYKIRYVRNPKPIILADLDGLTIDGYIYTTQTVPSGITNKTEGCELDPILHEDVLQRAVELAKLAWTATGGDNTQAVMAAGQRSE
jgi:hypothetical protein